MQSWSSLVKDPKQKGAWSLPHSRRGTISIMIIRAQYLTVNEWSCIRSYGLFLIQAFQYPVITGCAQPFPQHLHIRNGAVEIKIRLNTHPDFLHLINPHFHLSTPLSVWFWIISGSFLPDRFVYLLCSRLQEIFLGPDYNNDVSLCFAQALCLRDNDTI